MQSPSFSFATFSVWRIVQLARILKLVQETKDRRVAEFAADTRVQKCDRKLRAKGLLLVVGFETGMLVGPKRPKCLETLAFFLDM